MCRAFTVVALILEIGYAQAEGMEVPTNPFPELTFQVRSVKPTYSEGEPIFVDWELHNKSDQPVQVQLASGHAGFAFTLHCEGRLVGWSVRTPSFREGDLYIESPLTTGRPLDPDGHCSGRILLNEHYWFLLPKKPQPKIRETYEVEVSLELSVNQSSPSSFTATTSFILLPEDVQAVEKAARFWKNLFLKDLRLDLQTNAAAVLSHMHSNVLVPYLVDLLATHPQFARFFLPAFMRIGTLEALEALLTFAQSLKADLGQARRIFSARSSLRRVVESAAGDLMAITQAVLEQWQQQAAAAAPAFPDQKKIQDRIEQFLRDHPSRQSSEQPSLIPESITFIPQVTVPWLEATMVAGAGQSLGEILAELSQKGLSLIAMVESEDLDERATQVEHPMSLAELVHFWGQEKGYQVTVLAEQKALVIRSPAALRRVWQSQQQQWVPLIQYWQGALNFAASLTESQVDSAELNYIPERSLTADQLQWLRQAHPHLAKSASPADSRETAQMQVSIHITPVLTVRQHPIPEANWCLPQPWSVPASEGRPAAGLGGKGLSFARLERTPNQPQWEHTRVHLARQRAEVQEIVRKINEQVGDNGSLALDARVPPLPIYATLSGVTFWEAVQTLAIAMQLDCRVFPDANQVFLTFYADFGQQAEKLQQLVPLLDQDLSRQIYSLFTQSGPLHATEELMTWQADRYDIPFVELPPVVQQRIMVALADRIASAGAENDKAQWEQTIIEFGRAIVLDLQLVWGNRGRGSRRILKW
jgi:hypothetical protein